MADKFFSSYVFMIVGNQLTANLQGSSPPLTCTYSNCYCYCYLILLLFVVIVIVI